ncbi:hypothetical protein I4F81_004277 [Pyropia yezoensis]|uniref:Uncharacterized protein n=1 Tax=Pyropia yezoensis TaxID=2788 RepID=A0ACC3BW53_PYRYE|nr:hypothetical protein I4F81_004277 [Neopyropia yezoensis]
MAAHRAEVDDFSSAPTSVAPAVATAPAPTPPPLDKEHALLDEVWALIDRYYLTLRDAPAWADQRRKAASTPLGGSRTATYAAARRMLKTLGDPYTRLLTPDGMAALSKLSEFNASAAADTGAAFQRLAAAGADAYVLDLRGNPGGVFEGALDLAGLLDGDGTPAATVVDKSGASETFTGHVVGYEAPATPAAQEQTQPGVRRGGGLTGRALSASAAPTGSVAASAAVPPGRGVVVPLSAPLVVLLDDHSASSSEVLAGALRDNCRAVLAGGRSYGKGVIQGVFGLSDGSGLVVTVASYVTPRGDIIQERGLPPQLPLSAGLRERAGAALRGQPPPLEEKIDWTRVREQLSMCAAGEEDVVGDGRGGGWATPHGGAGDVRAGGFNVIDAAGGA